MSERPLVRAASLSRTMAAVALATVQAGLCAACIGTAPVAPAPPGPVVIQQEAARALEPDHWGDE